jgi:serine O-acetyltransferase
MYESNMIFKILGYILYPLYFFVTYYFLSYNIDPKVEIKGGLYVHNRDIVITDLCKIGKNFSIMGQTTIGLGLKSFGNIVIGDNVMVGVGAKIIASRDINIADDVIIGANAVVVKSLLVKNSVYGGIPAVFIKSNEK